MEYQEKLDALRLLGFQNCAHTGSNLLRHLVGTYRLLREWKAAPHVCDAGLYHSVYGLSFAETGIRPMAEQRGAISYLIGHQAEDLVFDYFYLDRALLFKSAEQGNAVLQSSDANDNDSQIPVPGSEQRLRDLCEILAANSVEQQTRVAATQQQYIHLARQGLLSTGAMRSLSYQPVDEVGSG